VGLEDGRGEVFQLFDACYEVAVGVGCGISRERAKTVARLPCLEVAYASAPAWVEPPGFHSPRALASAEM
jgi:hypothetical protein